MTETLTDLFCGAGRSGQVRQLGNPGGSAMNPHPLDGPGRRAGAEFRALLAAVALIAAVGIVSGAVGVADHIAAAVLIVAGLGWLAVAVLRRERRIRARLADPRTQPASRLAVEVPHARVGPGDAAPIPSAPTPLARQLDLFDLPTHDRARARVR